MIKPDFFRLFLCESWKLNEKVTCYRQQGKKTGCAARESETGIR